MYVWNMALTDGTTRARGKKKNDKKKRSRPGGAQNQAEALRREGVHVSRNAVGENLIDLKRYGWFVPVLPSEEGSSNRSGDEGENADEEDEEEEEE